MRADGTVTAGNASGVNDGAQALLIASGEAVERLGLTPLARIAGMATAGVPPRIMGIGPVPATRKLIQRLGLGIADFDLIELNEAFASQSLACLREFGLADDAGHVNPNGGAIAYGHPLGMSGARLAADVAIELDQARGALGTGHHVRRRRPGRRPGTGAGCLKNGKHRRGGTMTTAYPLESLEAHPKYLSPGYKSTVLRSPKRPLVILPHTMSELTGPIYGHEAVLENDSDLTKQHGGEPQGERIIVSGTVMDEDGRPIPNTLIEIWQANAAGRYIHVVDQHHAPLDPEFLRRRPLRHRRQGPLQVHHRQARRLSLEEPPQRLAAEPHPLLAVRPELPDPAGHPDVFSRRPADPIDPIANSVTDPKALQRMIAVFDLETTVPEWALGYRFDIVLRGHAITPFEDPHHG